MGKILMASGRVIEVKDEVVRRMKGRPLNVNAQVDLQNGLTVFVRQVEAIMEDDEGIKYVTQPGESMRKKAGRPKTKETVIK